MSIEVATYIGDLQPVNPPSTDPRGQGDDHLRLIKQVLQNSFPMLEKAIYFPVTTAKSSNFSPAATDMSGLFLVATTGGAVTITLPGGLGSGDSGWFCRFMKTTSDANPIFIAPATGTLTSGAVSGLSQARRCIPGVEFKATWTGTAWIISRCVGLPIGSMVDFNSATLPFGYEWPNGQTLASVATNYPEFNAVNGGGLTLDLRGRIAVTLDNLGGSAAGRLAGGVITGSAIGNTGGSDTRSLITSNLPPYTPTGSIVNGAIALSGNITSAANGVQGCIAVNNSGAGPVNLGATISTSQGTSTFNGSAQGGTSVAFGILQPSIMCSKILIVE